MRLANRGRLLLRTPGPVPFGTCICCNVETILSWTCHVYGPFEFRTSVGTSILLCIWLCFTVLQIRFECLQFASILVGIMPLLELQQMMLLRVQTARSTAYFNGCPYIFDILLYYYIFVCTTFLWPLRFGWLLVLSLYKKDYLQIFKCVSFRLPRLLRLVGRLSARKPV